MIGKPVTEQQVEPMPAYKSNLAPDNVQLGLIAGTFRKDQINDETFNRMMGDNNPPAGPAGQRGYVPPANDNVLPVNPVANELTGKFTNLLDKLKRSTNPIAPSTPAIEPAAPIQNEPAKIEGESLYDLLMKTKDQPEVIPTGPVPIANQESQASSQQVYSEDDIVTLSNMIEAQKNSINTIDTIFDRAKSRGMNVEQVYDIASKMTPDSFLDYVQYKMTSSAPRPPQTIANSPTYRGATNSGQDGSGYKTTTIRV